jgi:hypothetical protein
VVVNTLAEISEHVIACPHGKSNDRHGRGLIRRTWKNARVADVKVCNALRRSPGCSSRSSGRPDAVVRYRSVAGAVAATGASTTSQRAGLAARLRRQWI